MESKPDITKGPPHQTCDRVVDLFVGQCVELLSLLVLCQGHFLSVQLRSSGHSTEDVSVQSTVEDGQSVAQAEQDAGLTSPLLDHE